MLLFIPITLIIISGNLFSLHSEGGGICIHEQVRLKRDGKPVAILQTRWQRKSLQHTCQYTHRPNTIKNGDKEQDED